MKKTIIIAMALISCVTFGQEEKKCENRDNFSKVQVYDGIIATLERSEENKLCEGVSTKLEDLLITLEEGVLRIRKIAGKKYEKQPHVRIQYVNISVIEGYAKADLDTRNLIKSDSLTIVLKSGSRFYADCDVKYLNADVSEGSLLKIDGYAVEQVISSAGKATFSGFELEGETAEVKAAKGGTIKLNIEKSITGTSSTGGYVGYKNSPKVDVKKSMGGRLVASE